MRPSAATAIDVLPYSTCLAILKKHNLEEQMPEESVQASREAMAIAQAIREAMAIAKIGQKELANKCKVSDKTIQRALNGFFTRTTLFRIEECLGKKFDNKVNQENLRIASKSHGSYLEDNYEDYPGDYLCYRRSFLNKNNVVVFHMVIEWCDDKNCFCFKLMHIPERESGSCNKYYRDGEIYINRDNAFIHFLMCNIGAVRIITTCPLRVDDDNTMRGIVLTMTELTTLAMQPATAPIVLQRQEAAGIEVVNRTGIFDFSHEAVSEMHEKLIETEKNYAIFNIIGS
jgi:hypothetical protein